jgi:hypothetical protein
MDESLELREDQRTEYVHFVRGDGEERRTQTLLTWIVGLSSRVEIEA